MGIGDKIGHTDLDLVSKSMRPDGLILKPSRPLVAPDYLIWDMSPRQASGTTEYETWSEVAGHRFGIILCYNPGEPEQEIRSHHLENYQFQLDDSTDFIATFVTYKNNHLVRNQTLKPRKWTRKQPLRSTYTEGFKAEDEMVLVRPNKKSF